MRVEMAQGRFGELVESPEDDAGSINENRDDNDGNEGDNIIVQCRLMTLAII